MGTGYDPTRGSRDIVCTTGVLDAFDTIDDTFDVEAEEFPFCPEAPNANLFTGGTVTNSDGSTLIAVGGGDPLTVSLNLINKWRRENGNGVSVAGPTWQLFTIGGFSAFMKYFPAVPELRVSYGLDPIVIISGATLDANGWTVGAYADIEAFIEPTSVVGSTFKAKVTVRIDGTDVGTGTSTTVYTSGGVDYAVGFAAGGFSRTATATSTGTGVLFNYIFDGTLVDPATHWVAGPGTFFPADIDDMTVRTAICAFGSFLVQFTTLAGPAGFANSGISAFARDVSL